MISSSKNKIQPNIESSPKGNNNIQLNQNSMVFITFQIVSRTPLSTLFKIDEQNVSPDRHWQPIRRFAIFVGDPKHVLLSANDQQLQQNDGKQ